MMQQQEQSTVATVRKMYENREIQRKTCRGTEEEMQNKSKEFIGLKQSHIRATL